MSTILISPKELTLEEKDYLLIQKIETGLHAGKYAYINVLNLKRVSAPLFDKEDYREVLDLIQNEIASSEDVIDSFTSWFNLDQILIIREELVEEFETYYEMSHDGGMAEILEETQYDRRTTLAKAVILNSMSILMEISEEAYLAAEEVEEE